MVIIFTTMETFIRILNNFNNIEMVPEHGFHVVRMGFYQIFMNLACMVIDP